MKTYIFTTLLMVSLLCKNSFAQQQNETEKHRYIGFGIRLPGIQVSDIQARALPPARIIASVDPIEFFRVEFQYGFNSTKAESKEPSANKAELEARTSVFTLGAMGMYPKGNARFILGVRYGIGNYKEELWESYPTAGVSENKGKTKTISGVIGGEYLVARFFSIGCEFTISSVKDEYKPALSDNGSVMSKASLTEGNIILKFYPF